MLSNVAIGTFHHGAALELLTPSFFLPFGSRRLPTQAVVDVLRAPFASTGL